MKVLIADDHPMVRDALGRTLLLLDPAVSVLQAADFSGVVASIDHQIPDLVLLDLNMPGMDGVAGLRRLRLQFPELVLVVASAEDDPVVIRCVLAVGVAGYLPKTESADLHLQALRIILSGGTYMPRQAMSDFRDGEPPTPKPDTSSLTPRQMDVLRLLMRGEPNKVIARELCLAEGTVKLHVTAIRRTLQARNRTEVVVIARDLGIKP